MKVRLIDGIASGELMVGQTYEVAYIEPEWSLQEEKRGWYHIISEKGDVPYAPEHFEIVEQLDDLYLLKYEEDGAVLCPLLGGRIDVYSCLDICLVAEGEGPDFLLPKGFELTAARQEFCMNCKLHPDL